MINIKGLSRTKKIQLLFITLVFLGLYVREVVIGPVSVGILFRKAIIMLLLYGFAALHCFFPAQKIYQTMFDKRWWIGLLIFFFLVVNKYNFSSISTFDGYVQPGEGSVYVQPLFGRARGIRSDEWMVNLPRVLTGEYTHFQEYNDIVCATETTNISASGLYLNYSALAKPADWGYYILGAEYGLAWHWAFKMVFGFLFMLELFYILTDQNRLYAMFGAALTWFSAYNLWWSTVNWLWSGSAAIVFFVYFLKTDKNWKRAIFGCIIALMGASFALDLYPAWLVPAGYTYLALLVWAMVKFYPDWKKFRIVEWVIAFVCICFMASLIIVYLLNYREYMQAITNTAYPGKRVSYGGYALYKMLGYFSAEMASFINYGNPCESACFFAVYPLGYFLGIWALIKQRGKNLLLWLLAIPTTILTWYCYTEMPPAIAQALLLTYSVPTRAVDVLGFLLAIIVVVSLVEICKDGGINTIFAFLLASFSTSMAARYCFNSETSMKRKAVVIAFALVTIGIETLIIGKSKRKHANIAMGMGIIFLVVTGISVHPLNYGIDAIKSKPVGKEIEKIVKQNENAKWIALDSMVTGNYLIACGAPTYNSSNYIPNMELWHMLDVTGQNDEIYNRYAHVIISLANETSMGLLAPDCVVLNLSFDDLDKMNVEYIYCQSPLNNSGGCEFELVYNEAGSYIYQHIK